MSEQTEQSEYVSSGLTYHQSKGYTKDRRSRYRTCDIGLNSVVYRVIHYTTAAPQTVQAAKQQSNQDLHCFPFHL